MSKHSVITHQAFVRIDSDSQWVYCKWSDGKFTRYRSTAKMNARGIISFDMGPMGNVTNPPLYLDWKSTSK